METNTFKDLLPEDLRNCEASPAVWAYIADLLAKVSEQEKEIERLKENNERLQRTRVNKVVSEQSQRIQQLEGLLDEVLNDVQYADNKISEDLRKEIKAALNRVVL